MAQPVAQRLMEQMRLVGEMKKELEAAGKIWSKAQKQQILAVEYEKLEALKQEQLAQRAPRVPPEQEEEGAPTWVAAIASVQPSAKSKARAEYVDFPGSKHASDPGILKHSTFSTFAIGREAIRKGILEGTLYQDMPQTKKAMTKRMNGRVSGAGAPGNGYLDWEFNDGRGMRCDSMICPRPRLPTARDL